MILIVLVMIKVFQISCLVGQNLCLPAHVAMVMHVQS